MGVCTVPVIIPCFIISTKVIGTDDSTNDPETEMKTLMIRYAGKIKA